MNTLDNLFSHQPDQIEVFPAQAKISTKVQPILFTDETSLPCRPGYSPDSSVFQFSAKTGSEDESETHTVFNLNQEY